MLSFGGRPHRENKEFFWYSFRHPIDGLFNLAIGTADFVIIMKKDKPAFGYAAICEHNIAGNLGVHVIPINQDKIKPPWQR